eukprot:4161390-Pyramimonas_sp.AAC.1
MSFCAPHWAIVSKADLPSETASASGRLAAPRWILGPSLSLQGRPRDGRWSKKLLQWQPFGAR